MHVVTASIRSYVCHIASVCATSDLVPCYMPHILQLAEVTGRLKKANAVIDAERELALLKAALQRQEKRNTELEKSKCAAVNDQ